MRRANDLKQQELLLRDQRGEENYWKPKPPPVKYVPTAVKQQGPPKETKRGGMNIEPQ